MSEIWRGKSVARSYLNLYLRSRAFKGRVIDIGAGGNRTYLSFHPDHTLIEPFDVRLGASVNFEKDPLPFADNAFDTVLLLNVLEHLFNPAQLLSEIQRILRSGGTLEGFVPFFMRYHPDPHDYFRYTHEALYALLRQAEWKEIAISSVGGGPFSSALQQVLPFVPRIFKPLCFLACTGFDFLIHRLHPSVKKEYPLGYYFSAVREK